jgi:hypothetical protein
MLGLKTLLLMLKNKIKIRYFPPIAGFFLLTRDVNGFIHDLVGSIYFLQVMFYY